MDVSGPRSTLSRTTTAAGRHETVPGTEQQALPRRAASVGAVSLPAARDAGPLPRHPATAHHGAGGGGGVQLLLRSAHVVVPVDNGVWVRSRRSGEKIGSNMERL